MAPRTLNRLPASFKKLGPGLHADGGNLYLQSVITKNGNVSRSWIFRYQLTGQKLRDMGLGSLNDVSLAEARELARANRRLLKEGIDPIEHRNKRVAQNLTARDEVMTFEKAAAAYIRQHQAGWKNPKHAAQWATTLDTYAMPVLGKMSVADIQTKTVMKVIEPIWLTKTETASRVRGRIESILGWAATSGCRPKGDNPARWDNHLENLLTKKSKIRAVKHQAALPYADMPAFMVELRARKGMAALALEFAILTCVRTADVRDAKDADIDRKAAIWTIPALSKTGLEHRVPSLRPRLPRSTRRAPWRGKSTARLTRAISRSRMM